MNQEAFDALIGETLTSDDGQVFVLERVETLGERAFSLFFTGPPRLPQRLYALSHPVLGRQEIFLVPIAVQKYQAIFN